MQYQAKKIIFLTLITFLFSPALIKQAVGDEKLQENKTDIYHQLDVFSQAFELIRKQYVDEVSAKDLINSAIKGMLRDLDPHSTYLRDDSLEDVQISTKGEFGGLGIEVTLDETGFIRVVSPIDDTPAFKAGVQAQDLITHLDGESISGMTLQEAVDIMRGPVGEAITITVFREGSDPFDIEIIRDVIKIKAVRWRVEDNIGYIRISSFSEQTEPGLIDAFEAIKKETKIIKGYILDLRNNPGGLLSQAIFVSDSFLDRGEILSTRGRESTSLRRFHAEKGDLSDGLPVVVLINRGSASASEIVAGALQDHRRGVILGTKSFGKGSVQTIIPVDQQRAAVKLTTQRYYTPSGRSIQAEGIQPDILIEQIPVPKNDNNNRLDFSEAKLHGAINQKTSDQADDIVDDENKEDDTKSPQKTQENNDDDSEKITLSDATLNDYQLLRAIDIIQALSLFKQ